MRFEVLTAVKMSMLVFWVVTMCGLVGRYQRLGETVSIFRAEVCFSKTLFYTYKFKRIYDPEEQHRQKMRINLV
jgi:hypothetical protein